MSNVVGEEKAQDDFYYLRRFPRMPFDLKKALYSLNSKLNINSSALLQATEILLQEAEQEGEEIEDINELLK